MRTLAVCFLCCLPLVGQDQDPATAYVTVQTSPLGNVSIRIATFDLAENERSALPNAIPEVLNCNWARRKNTAYSIEGVCLGWLKPGSGSLHLADLVQSLHSHGAEIVTVYLDVRSSKNMDTPLGWISETRGRTRSRSFSFTSASPRDVPSDVAVPLEAHPNFIIPILVVLLIPTALAFRIRLRATNAPPDRKVNWVVWMNWINLGAWLYWMSATNVTELGESFLGIGSASEIVALILGVVVYSFPPLISQSICFLAMSSLLSSSKESFKVLFRRQLVGQASLVVPLGIFLVGSGMNSFTWGLSTMSLVAAYLVYRFLAWTQWSLSYGNVTPIESGPLFDRAAALARKAGVTLTRLSLLHTRVPEEANAFATSGDRIILTESLVKGLTEREVDAVIAHELGHHKSGHLRFNLPQLLFWAYILLAGPLLGWLASRFQLPGWVLTIPILPLTFLVLQGVFSQRRELEADAAAVELTGDPEGKIAALARLAQLSRIPVQGGGMMASILSHPSMERRVLALARRFHVPDVRALAILHNPDDAYTTARPVFAAPESVPSAAPSQNLLFNTRAKVVYIEKLRWLHLLAPLAGAALFGAAAQAVIYRYLAMRPMFIPGNFSGVYHFQTMIRLMEIMTLVVGPFLVLGLTLLLENLLWRHFLSRLREKLAERLAPSRDAVFISIHPGRGVRYTEGFSDWDFGFLSTEDDWLCYRGEKTRFAIPRHNVTGITMVKGPAAWERSRRVEVVFTGGAFTLSRINTNGLDAWARASHSATSAPEPPPLLPSLPGIEASRIPMIWHVCKITFQLWIAGPLLIAFGWNGGLLAASVMLVGPLGVLLRFLPSILWPIRRPRQPAEHPESLLAPETM